MKIHGENCKGLRKAERREWLWNTLKKYTTRPNKDDLMKICWAENKTYGRRKSNDKINYDAGLSEDIVVEEATAVLSFYSNCWVPL